MKTAIYPGTFDPITNGHLCILQKGTKVFDKVVLAVAEFTGKDSVLSTEERYNLCVEATKDLPGVEVQRFDGLVVNFARKVKANAMIRGLRALSDFEYELSQALMNKKLYDEIDTVFFLPESKYLYLSSTMVRQVMQLGGDVHDLIPNCVEEVLRRKFEQA